jgi:hypothetical protein
MKKSNRHAEAAIRMTKIGNPRRRSRSGKTRMNQVIAYSKVPKVSVTCF